tara:strand:- start:1678 stop:2034 length:357 start_codon:yes stop_codon:yes gene_type:complete
MTKWHRVSNNVIFGPWAHSCNGEDLISKIPVTQAKGNWIYAEDEHGVDMSTKVDNPPSHIYSVTKYSDSVIPPYKYFSNGDPDKIEEYRKKMRLPEGVLPLSGGHSEWRFLSHAKKIR